MHNNKHYKILIVEDQYTDIELAQREIKKVLESCEFANTDSREEFLILLHEFNPDIIVSDYSMPNFDGLSVIKLTIQHNSLIPVIIFTGSINEETAADAVKAGAVDYVIKENIQRLRQAVLNAIETKSMWIERVEARERLSRFNQELESLVKIRTTELEQTNKKLELEISERIKAEAVIKLQLEEKEILMKEIHHRVKNNLQVIVSILNLQLSSTDDQKIIDILRDSQSRIKTMALIHETLYRVKNFTSINFSDYINNLVTYLFQSFKAPQQDVTYEIDAVSTPLEIDTSITLGLIANELISNAFKYAFTDAGSYSIKISLLKEKGNLLFKIIDNGKGLPQEIDFRNTKSLGLQLVCILTDQLNGTVELKTSSSGTQFEITFPC